MFNSTYAKVRIRHDIINNYLSNFQEEWPLANCQYGFFRNASTVSADIQIKILCSSYDFTH